MTEVDPLLAQAERIRASGILGRRFPQTRDGYLSLMEKKAAE